MKRRAMNSLADSLCRHLGSRNNDIAGYWGIGVLCAIARRTGRAELRFKIIPCRPIVISGRRLTTSNRVTDRLKQFNLDSIEGSLSFVQDGNDPHDIQWYTCGISITVTQADRTETRMIHVKCWPHNPCRESRRANAKPALVSLLDRLKDLLR